jgi:AraC-like DNA-binding protein
VVLDAAFHTKLAKVVSFRQENVLSPKNSECYIDQMKLLIDLPETENSEFRAMNVVEKIRMEKAASLLRYSSMKVSTVSNRVGFSHPFYFSLRFKKEFGVSPSEYREKV